MSDFTVTLYQKDNTTSLGALDKNLFCGGKVVDELNGEESLTFEADISNSDWPKIQHARILLLAFTDEDLTKRFRINDITKWRRGEEFGATVQCLSLKFDLSGRTHQLKAPIVKQTATTHLTAILAGSGFTVGTVTPTQLLSYSYNYNSALQDILRIVQETGYDLRVNDDKSVDIVNLGSASSTTIEFGKNLLTLSLSEPLPEANKIYALGGIGNDGLPMTVRNALFRVTAVSGTLITLDSDKIITSDNAYTDGNFYLLVETNTTLKTYRTITGSNKQGGGFDQFTVSATGGIAVDNYVFIADQQTLDFGLGDTPFPAALHFIADKSSIDTYGEITTKFQNESYEDVNNLLKPNADLENWTLGVPDGYTKYGSGSVLLTETTATAFLLNGSKSCKVQVDEFTSKPSVPTLSVSTLFFGQMNGSYTYKLAWATTDGIGPLTDASASVSPAFKAVDITKTGTPPANVTGWCVYRKKTTDAAYYKIAGNLPLTQSLFRDMAPDGLFTTAHPADLKAAGGQGIEYSLTAELNEPYSIIYNVFVSDHPSEGYGQMRLEVDFGERFPSTGIDETRVATTVQTKDSRFIVAIENINASNTAAKIRLLAHKGPSVFYVDSGTLVKSAALPSLESFYPESSAKQLWFEAYDILKESKDPKQKIETGVINLYPLDSVDHIEKGDTITVADTDLGINESVRIRRKTVDLLDPTNVQVEIASSQDEFTKMQADTLKKVTEQGSNLSSAANSVNQNAGNQQGKPRIRVFAIQDGEI